MGMMDGGDNFKDKCHACNGTAMGGTMLRSIDDRNKKICSNCHNKLSDEDKRFLKIKPGITSPATLKYFNTIREGYKDFDLPNALVNLFF